VTEKKEKEKGRKWDGKSRVSNDSYRKNFKEIFRKKPKLTDENAEEFVHGKWKKSDWAGG
jgi:hypothetical protein|tara:strand:- start:162 stop:341 length:180 start_codon:yes stop_codon:yes gene_type:complete